MAQEDIGLAEPGPGEGPPDLDIGPSAVEPGVLGDGSVYLPAGMDPLSDEAATFTGQPDEAGDLDVQQTHAPEETATGPQEPAQADTPERPWEQTVPDKLRLADLTDAQLAELAATDPGALRRHDMRLQDYREKTEELARRREALEREREALEQERATVPQQQQPGVQPQDAADAALTKMQAEGMRYYDDLRTKLGREPNYVEFSVYAANRASQEAAQEAIQPLSREVQETAAQFRQRQERDLADRLKTEWNALVDTHPQAATPQRQQAIYDFLSENPAMLTRPNPIGMAYRALFAEADAAAMQAGRDRARQQQAAASQQTPSAPPTGHTAPPVGAPADFDAFYEDMQRKARAGTLLDTMPHP